VLRKETAKKMKYLIALFLTLVGVGSTFARAQDTAVSTIPFDFIIGNQTFPAGKYSIGRSPNDVLGGPLLIRSADGKTSAFFFPTTEVSAQHDEGKLVFRHEGDKYFLAEIVGAEEVYTVGPDVRHQRPVDLDAAVSVATP
jgi:hypothetical protein